MRTTAAAGPDPELLLPEGPRPGPTHVLRAPVQRTPGAAVEVLRLPVVVFTGAGYQPGLTPATAGGT